MEQSWELDSLYYILNRTGFFECYLPPVWSIVRMEQSLFSQDPQILKKTKNSPLSPKTAKSSVLTFTGQYGIFSR